jgi:hypothetical protein
MTTLASTRPTSSPAARPPDGTEVAKSYGEVGRIPDALFKSLTSTFEGKEAPNPHDVAEAIVKLVGQSKRSRAVRTVVGAPFGSDKAQRGRRACPGQGGRGPRSQPPRKVA